MNQTPIVSVRQLRKSFCREPADYGLKDLLLHCVRHFRWKRDRKRHTVIDGISFDLHPGESLAVLGSNGTGKSTLLELVAGILRPEDGSVHIRGRIGLMLELGSGFCMELSGRENIELNAFLLGASKKMIREKTDAIIEFSGLRESIDEPLRTYSSGMMTRLGFSIAVHVAPELLLIDEVLAVGDSEFQKICLQKLHELQKEGVAVILVTHSLEAVRQFCSRAIYLDAGKIRFEGSSEEVADAILREQCIF